MKMWYGRGEGKNICISTCPQLILSFEVSFRRHTNQRTDGRTKHTITYVCTKIDNLKVESYSFVFFCYVLYGWLLREEGES